MFLSILVMGISLMTALIWLLWGKEHLVASQVCRRLYGNPFDGGDV